MNPQDDHLIMESEEAYYVKAPLISISNEDIEWLKERVNDTARKRIRICTHPDVSDRLHEMFVCYTRDTQIAPHKHLGKDEVFYVMEGDMEFLLLDDEGNVTHRLPMGDRESGKAFCVRVPRDTFHTVRLHSEFCVLHEATPGPFIREDTKWAQWTVKS